MYLQEILDFLLEVIFFFLSSMVFSRSTAGHVGELMFNLQMIKESYGKIRFLHFVCSSRSQFEGEKPSLNCLSLAVRVAALLGR